MATAKNAKSKQTETVKEAVVEKTQPKSTKRKDTRIPLDVEVPCLCNVKGGLIYTSTRAGGMNAEWSEFGEMQYLDIRELLLMRNTQKRFFNDNWISLKDTDDGEYTADDVYKFLRVDDKYGDFYDVDNIESFFEYFDGNNCERVYQAIKNIK